MPTEHLFTTETAGLDAKAERETFARLLELRRPLPLGVWLERSPAEGHRIKLAVVSDVKAGAWAQHVKAIAPSIIDEIRKVPERTAWVR